MPQSRQIVYTSVHGGDGFRFGVLVLTSEWVGRRIRVALLDLSDKKFKDDPVD